MPIDLPTGYLTRPEAAKKYNRSQRALERDLDVALTIQDQELLSNWKLVTKDGTVRDGGAVSIEMVKELVTDGMTPAWCIAESFLAEKYGRKGEPKPSATAEKDSDSASETAKQPPRQEDTPRSSKPSHDDTGFLKDIIDRLEREKVEERKRHDRIVAKLFGELDVKNKQISAWDGVTQGLTRALATGQIAPNQRYLHGSNQRQERKDEQTAGASTTENEERTEDVIDAAPAASESTEKQTGALKKKTTRTRKTTKRKTSRKARPSNKPSKPQPPKPKWYETPTLKRIFSRND